MAEISASQLATIYALVKLAESRDDDTGEHIGRTSEYCRLMAEQLWLRGAYPDQIDPAFIESVAKASPLHDIGKVGLPDQILLKPGPISARIMALADVYDALRSKRVYKPGYSHEKSAAIIAQGRGQHFDPLLVDIFQQNEEAFFKIFDLS